MLYYKVVVIKQHGTGIKTNPLINRIQLGTHPEAHIPTATCFLKRRPAKHVGENTASSAHVASQIG